VGCRRLRDLLLFGAVATSAVVNLCVWTVPAAFGEQGGAGFAAAVVCGHAFVSVALAAAAWAPRDRIVIVAPRYAAAVVTVAVSAAALLGTIAFLPSGALVRVFASAQGAIAGHPLSLAISLAAVGLLVAASARFVARELAEGGSPPALLAGAALLLAGAGVDELSVGRLSPAYLGSAEGLRLAAFALLFTVALRRERERRAQTASIAAIAERRRVACDLHDGIAQDLAFIAAQEERLAQVMGAADPVVAAASRALAVSRRTISDLADPDGATLEQALRVLGRDLAARFEISVSVDVRLADELPAAARERTTRIVREAIVNAARHGQARNVIVSVARLDGGVSLRVVDDGHGVAPFVADGSSDGFGLRNLRDWAAALGGELTITRLRLGGTELTVVF